MLGHVNRCCCRGLNRWSIVILSRDWSDVLPAGGHVVFPGHSQGVEEYLYVHRGDLTVVANGQRHLVREGSTLFYPAHVVHEFHDQSEDAAEFFILVDDTRTR